jgi:iron complex outermembrane receptor protein
VRDHPLKACAAAIALAAGLSALPRGAAAQATGAVFGTVHDPAGRPLAGAVVSVAGDSIATRADSAGRYHLDGIPAGRVTLRVRQIGYRSRTHVVNLPAGDSVQVDVVLATGALADTFALGPVIVTAAKRSQLLDNAVTSVALVADSQIARRAVNTVDEAIDKAPGVQFLNGQVNIRGSTGYVQGINSRVLLLVDGVPSNQGDRGGINWDLLPVDQIERVEILKGPGSALYGSAALGGVVNLITRDLPIGLSARVRATGGVFADPPHDVWRFRDATGVHGGVDASVSYGTERLRARVAAGARHADGYREQDEADHWQVAAKTEWYPALDTRVDVAGAWAVHDYQVPLAWCNRGECDDRGQTYQPFKIDTTEAGAHTDSRKGYLSASVTRTPSERITWLARGSWLRTEFVDVRPSANEFADANRLGAELRLESHPNEATVVTVGAEATRADVGSNIFGDHSQGEYAAYGEGEQRVGAARLTVGARVDYLTVDGGSPSAVVSPRFGAMLPSGAGTWRASVGRGFRAPTLAERFVNTFALGFEIIPNPALTPETAWSAELGNVIPLPLPGARLDAAVFWTEAHDLIEPALVLVAGTPKIQLRNVARARIRGLDAAVVARPLTPRLTLTAAYQYLDARELATDSTAEEPLAFRPRHLLTLSGDYALGPVGVGADLRYASRVESIELEGFVDERRVPVAVLDLRARWAAGPVSLQLIAANLLNYQYNLVPETLAPVRTVSVVAIWIHE